MRASLRAVYQVDLDDPGMGASALADLVAWLPPGSALWRQLGGPMAWPDEVAMLAVVERQVRVLAWQQTKDGRSGTNPPRPMEPPPNQLTTRRAQADLSHRAQRYLERQRRRGRSPTT